MTYTDEQQNELIHGYASAYSELRDLMLECVRQTATTDVAASKEHLLHGVARRLGVMSRAMQQVFALFPPDTDKRLPMDSIHDVQINLHAFVINLYGTFENFAWAFVLRHDLLSKVGMPQNVSMFKAATQKHLPSAVTDYLSSERTLRWHTDYLKSYRDALAHRIPLYIPPMTVTEEQRRRYDTLESEKWGLTGKDKWDRINEISAEQSALGSPCFTFLHSFDDGGVSRPLYLHPQIISDSNTVIEFGRLFLAAWHERR